MPVIREYVRLNLPETYAEMEKQYTQQGQDVVGPTIARIMAETFEPATDEADLTEATRAHLGDMVTRAIIPPAIDMYQVQARIAEAANGESTTYYDVIDGLLKLDMKLKARIEKNQAIFASIAGEDLLTVSTPVSVPKVASAGTPFITTDPNEFRGINDV